MDTNRCAGLQFDSFSVHAGFRGRGYPPPCQGLPQVRRSSARGQKARNLGGIDPCQPASLGGLNHGARVDPGDPGLIDYATGYWPNTRQLERTSVRRRGRIGADLDNHLFLRVNCLGKRQMKPRDSGRQYRWMPGHGIVKALDRDLFGKPRRAQIDLEIRHRPVVERPVQITLETGQRPS